MGFYSQRILPYLFDWSLSSTSLTPYRQEILADVQGAVLEIGFGTGLNLPYYPNHIRKIVTVDPNPGVHKLAQKRIAESPIAVEHQLLTSESLPMPDHTFDSVVSTFTLCSIADVEQALSEIYRVLKPSGRFFFVEHGLGPEPGMQVWQNRLTPLQKIIGDGCHLNRNMRELIDRHFDSVKIAEKYVEGLPKVGAYLYKGIATKK
ncbi:MAG: class I SAM-dependent methyltransferase [Leptolyngbyaceae cyanobacterium bins.59]|nr:class I SAM-dependent methyltransferase [Leptolyngbyaceae cyanobacterium bins.59]